MIPQESENASGAVVAILRSTISATRRRRGKQHSAIVSLGRKELQACAGAQCGFVSLFVVPERQPAGVK